MNKICKKQYLIFATFSLVLALIVGLNLVLLNPANNKMQASVNVERTIEVQDSTINYQSILDEFEEAKMEKVETLITFEGYQNVSMEDLSELDNLSESDIEDIENIRVKYNFSYDTKTNIVTVSAESKDSEGIISIEEISGIAFINNDGQMDAILDLDDNFVLLSELNDCGSIQNCGWFKNLFSKISKIAVAAVTVAVVATVAAVVVATAGAGLGAVVAAGAIAGGVTGGVAGGIISYSEYDKLDWKWIVGGAVIGAALGAVVGWGVGSAVGAGSAKTAGYLSKNFNFTETVLGHTDRPYRDSQLLAKEIMQAGNPVADSSLANGLKWIVAGSFNGTNGIWELVYDVTTNTIVHFLFKV